MSEMESGEPKPATHILVYPFAGAGHIIPLLDLTHLLLTGGLTVTVLVDPANRHLVDPLLSSHPRSLSTLLLSHDDSKFSSLHPLLARIRASSQLFDPIVEWFRCHPSPPVAIISDFFLGWTCQLAAVLGVPRIVFWPSGALASLIFQSVWRDLPENHHVGVDGPGGLRRNFLLSFPEIPNSPAFPWWQLTHLRDLYVKGDADWEAFREGIVANFSSWGVVYNSFHRLEGVYIDHVRSVSGHDKVWAVGPLLPDDDNGPIPSMARGGSRAMSSRQLTTWLDEKPENSVVHVCFGSRMTLSREQMEALTDALERSKVHFILCVKEADCGFVPNGFEARLGGRGIIVKGWVPQVAILRHSAVGAFVTHCGWNSVLEGVAAGVVMLTWPMGADQFSNAKLLVDELGVGARVCEGGPESVPNASEMARLLDDSIGGGIIKREKVNELRDAAAETVKTGSSKNDLDMLIKLLSQL